MTRPNVFKVRLSDEELEWLKDYAESKQLTPAEVVRQYIQTLNSNKKSH
jgi:hypothetical protein